MTSTPVTEKSTFFPSITNNVNVKESPKDAFADCFSQVRSQKNQTQSEVPRDNAEAETDVREDKTELPAKGNALKEKAPVKAENKPEPVDKEGQEEAVTEISNRIAEAVAAQLGIPVEQVLEAMKAMNMTPADMLDGGQLTDLVMKLAGGENQVDLLTNENLFQTVKELTQTVEGMVEELQTALGMNDEEFETMLQDMSETMKAEPQDKEQDTLTQTAEKQPVIEISTEAGETDRQKTGRTETANPEDTPETATGENRQAVGKETQMSENGGGQTDSHKKGEGETSQFQHPVQQTAGITKTDQTIVLENTVNSFQETADTENIMRQIMDYMKIQVKADLTQMEIQLHPASLGNINVQITSKGGAITAQFTAQNESVKAALESQVVQLRETLNEQGVKVEAVEVTIASHEFERNLSQNQSGNKETGEQTGKSARRMNLNLSEIGAEGELPMEEEDRLTADIMARNGNTVDFSA